jgi:hypothetical protein
MFSVNVFSNSQEETLQIWTVGLPDLARQRVMDRLAQKYGFEFFPVAGCDVTKEKLENVKQHNDEVRARISKVHGERWWDQFQKELNEILNAKFQAEKIVRSQAEVIDKISAMNSIQKDIQLYSEERGNGKYLIRVLGLECGEERVYYTFTVDLKNSSIERKLDGFEL